MDNFRLIARAVIIKDGKILLCQKKNESYYFLPGGGVESLEKAEVALEREVREELGMELVDINYIGTIENIYESNHEINLVFEGKIKENINKSLEEHIDFYWLDINQIKEKIILPQILKDNIIKWQKDKNCFWGSFNNEKTS